MPQEIPAIQEVEVPAVLPAVLSVKAEAVRTEIEEVDSKWRQERNSVLSGLRTLRAEIALNKSAARSELQKIIYQLVELNERLVRLLQ